MKRTSPGPNKKNLLVVLIATVLILLVPLIAMQFSDDVNWGPADFITIGGLLIAAGLGFELISSRVSPKYRLWVGLLTLLVVLIIWVELAVGVLGTPFGGS